MTDKQEHMLPQIDERLIGSDDPRPNRGEIGSYVVVACICICLVVIVVVWR